jgi:hypothetical protein
MPLESTHNVQGGERDLLILDHVMRYRLTTPEVLHRLFFFEDADRNAVTKVTSRLCDREMLLSHQLYASFTYFTLGRHGARLTGLAAKKVRPLGPQALYREYGTLVFCCLANPPREKFRVSDVAAKFPQILARNIDSSHYYTDCEGKTERLGYIWVEGGGPLDHIVRTVRQDIIERRRDIPLLRQNIDSGRFVVAVVTCNADKRNEIAAALRNIATPVFFRVEAVPELIHLLRGARNG